MISYTTSCELSEFPAWSGGKVILEELKKHPRACDYIENFLSMYTGDEMDAAFINDFLWFEALEILEEAGLYDIEKDVWMDEAEYE